MGIFQDLMPVVNRCPWPLTIRFDGQENTLAPGLNHIPRLTWLYALNQHPLMGSGDVNNPNVSGCEYLIGDPEKPKKYPCDPLTKEQIELQTNNPSRFDYLELMEARMGKHDKIEVRGRKTARRAEVSSPALVGTDRND